jgi:hypothetical protein
VSARNWVGTGEVSEALQVSIPYRISQTATVIEGEGISEIYGAVTTSVSITAYDEDGILNA